MPHSELLSTLDITVFKEKIKQLFTRTVHLGIRTVRYNP